MSNEQEIGSDDVATVNVGELIAENQELHNSFVQVTDKLTQAKAKVGQQDAANQKLRAQLTAEIQAKELAETELAGFKKALQTTKGGPEVLERIASSAGQ